MNYEALITDGMTAVVALTVIAAWRSIRRRHIAAGGSYTWTFLALKWTVPAPPAEVVPEVPEAPAAEQPTHWDARDRGVA